jgi:hypothetical protein
LGATLSGAFDGASLAAADLAGAKIYEAKLDAADFTGVDLSQADASSPLTRTRASRTRLRSEVNERLALLLNAEARRQCNRKRRSLIVCNKFAVCRCCTSVCQVPSVPTAKDCRHCLQFIALTVFRRGEQAGAAETG